MPINFFSLQISKLLCRARIVRARLDFAAKLRKIKQIAGGVEK